MILDRISFRRKPPPGTSHQSVLDMPVTMYDPVSHLPARIQIGGRYCRPLVHVGELRDHLTLLAAFHHLKERAGPRFHRVMDSAAFEYERWASTVLPVRARRKHSAASETSLPTLPEKGGLELAAEQQPEHSLPMTRASTWSPPESPVSEISSAASSSSPHVSSFPPLTADELPPLEVLMCWHAHLHSPAQFAVDADGTYKWLYLIPFPLKLAARAIRDGTLPTDVQHVYANNLRPIPSISGWTPPDISAAVARQARLIAIVHSIGWLEDSYINSTDIAPFQTSIVRYHAWLDLISTVGSFVAPTLDIMLSWGTHQLHGSHYSVDTYKLLGRTLDRPITRAADADAAALKHAAMLWKGRFRHEYFSRKTQPRRCHTV